MDGLQQYFQSAITAAIICGILLSLTEYCYLKNWIQVICGIFLATTILTPLLHMDLESILLFSFPDFQEIRTTTHTGEQTSKEALAEIIIKETEAYILDMASSLEADIAVEISLNTSQIPEKVTIHGAVSTLCRQKLENMLVSDLGITKENQVWTG